MAQSIFVTGAGGFIGQALLRCLSATTDYSVKALMRQPSPQNASIECQPQQVIGDLLDRESYRAALTGCDTVVHLAAVTGRASPRHYEQVNLEGTRILLQACKAAGVRRFLHMSTIAAGYPDQRYYPYARTKVQAEELVRQSGLAYAIIRPTLVLGKKSPIWNTLLKIAKLPLVPLPEGDRSVLVQPVHVDDVVRGIALLLDSGRLGDEVLELGGPRPLMLAEFLGLVQSALRGEAGRIVRVPLSPVRMLLAMMEPALRPVMPVTAGQLAVFANDSTASENWLLARLRADMPSIEATIAALIDVADADTKSGRDTRPLKRQVRSMSEGTKRLLDKECHTYVACLLGTTPSAYVREQYIRAAHLHGLAFDDEFTRFDLVALALARRWRVFARCADAYCALFHRSGALRRKLIVLAAILEHVPPTSEAFDRVPPRHVALAALSVFAYCSMFAVSLILGAVVLAPASILCWIANALDGRQHPREAR